MPDNESADESESEFESESELEYDSLDDTDYNETTDAFLSGNSEEIETESNSSEEIEIDIEKDKKRIARRLELLNKLKAAEPKNHALYRKSSRRRKK